MRHFLLLSCIALSGCSAVGSSASPPTSPATSSEAPVAPFRVHWKLISDSNGRLQIAAVVERRAVFHSPIEVTVEIPQGLSLRSGQPSFQIAPEVAAGETEISFEFTYSKVPTSDLKLVAQMSGAGMGVRATDEYRFGRAEVHPSIPNPTGPNVKAGETDLGPSIQLDSSRVESHPANGADQPVERRRQTKPQ